MLRVLLGLILSLSIEASNANVLGDMQTFAPNSDGLDFITVHTARPLNKGFFAFGGHFTFAKDHLLVYRDMVTQEKYDYKDSLAEFDLTIAYGLGEKFSVFFAAPFLLYHESDSGQEVDAEVSKGVHTYRPGIKWSFTDSLAFIGTIDILNVTNSPYTGVDSNPIYNMELAKTFRGAGSVTYGLNLGYRIRTPTERPVDGYMFPLDDQLTFSAGRSAPAWTKSRWVLEGIFSYPIQQDPYDDAIDASSVDILVGFKHRLVRNLNFDWGGTVEPFVETLAPRWRVFAGLVYYWNPGWFGGGRETPPPAATPAAEERGGYDDFEVSPQYAEVFEGTVVRFKVTGGLTPYSYRVIKGAGRLNVESAYYRAPQKPEVAEIEVRDSRDQIRIVEVTVKTPPKPNETIRIKNLNFIFNTATLVEDSRREIARIVGIFRNKKVSSIIVEGHTDSKGDDEYNMELSEKRADAVAQILIRDLGLRPEQVSIIGFGESRPVATNETEAGRLLNRRVDLKVYYR